MDKKLHIVQHLYGEGEDRTDLGRLLEEEAAREEYEALSQVKAHLDLRPRVRPDPQVIDRVVAAAAVPSRFTTPALKQQDRAARPRLRLRRFGLIGAVSTALAVVLAVGIGLDALRTSPSALPESQALAPAASAVPREEAGVEGAEAEVGASEFRRFAPEKDAEPQPVPPALGFQLADQDGARAEEAEAAPTWDESDELLRVHRHIEMLRARSLDSLWDESAVISLDSLQMQHPGAASGLDAASTRRPGGQQP